MADKKYDKYFLSYDGAEPKANDYTSLNSLPPFPEIASPQTYFRGAPALPGATATIGWQVFTAPVCWETIPHVHKYDEFLIFLGAQLPDLCKSFDAEIDLWMGKELEKHTIDLDNRRLHSQRRTALPVEFQSNQKAGSLPCTVPGADSGSHAHQGL